MMQYLYENEGDEFKDPEIVNWKRVREAIAHENTLTNYRLTWFLISQGLLFTAFTSMFQVSKKNGETSVIPDINQIIFVLEWTIPFIGFLTCIYLAIHLHTGHTQHNVLRKWWEDNYGKSPRSPKICGGSSRIATVLGVYVFPYIFAAGWLLILFRFKVLFLLTKIGFAL